MNKNRLDFPCADISSEARYILVVEKGAVFGHLRALNFCKENPCIVITGKGYPDIATRRPRHRHNLSIWLLGKSSKVKTSSQEMAYDARFLRVQKIQWLGAFVTNAKDHDLPEEDLKSLKPSDTRKIRGMLKRCYLRNEVPEWSKELKNMLRDKVSFDLEVLLNKSLSYIKNYISEKIKTKQRENREME
ncbi:hypothetical protein PTKIN_Ptkin10aG0009500 [Pterospermum kingtungense]